MKPKEFDAVLLMRELRDRLSEKYASMSIAEEIADLHQHVAHTLSIQQKQAATPDIAYSIDRYAQERKNA